MGTPVQARKRPPRSCAQLAVLEREHLVGQVDDPGVVRRAQGGDALGPHHGLQQPHDLQAVVRAEGITALVAPHDAGIVDLADQVFTLEDGKLGA